VFSIQNSKTLQHAPRKKPAKKFILIFQLLETKRKEQSVSKRRQ